MLALSSSDSAAHEIVEQLQSKMIIGVCVLHQHLRLLSLALALATLLLLLSLEWLAAAAAPMATSMTASAMTMTMAHALLHFVMLWCCLHHHQRSRLLLLTLLLALCFVFLALATTTAAGFLHSACGIVFTILQLNEFHRTRCAVVVIENRIFHTILDGLLWQFGDRCDNGYIFIFALLIRFIRFILFGIAGFLFARVGSIVLLLLLLLFASGATICGIRFGFSISFSLPLGVPFTLRIGLSVRFIIVVCIVFTIIGGLFWRLKILVLTAQETGSVRDRERERDADKKPVSTLCTWMLPVHRLRQILLHILRANFDFLQKRRRLLAYGQLGGAITTSLDGRVHLAIGFDCRGNFKRLFNCQKVS